MQHSKQILDAIRTMKPAKATAEHPLYLMEVCGTHTMAIAEAGLRQLLPDWVKLISGPGCPVCVTPAGAIDEVLRIAMLPDTVICSYGDLLRIPGSRRGESLKACKAKGADVRIVYSAVDAVDLAEQDPSKQYIFIGVGFETTAPGTAAAVLEASERGLKNFSVLSLMKYTLPAVNAILADPECRLDGLICPGHVATVIGAEAFRYLPEEHGVPAVVAGFEQDDVVKGVYDLLVMLNENKPGLINDYSRAVRTKGNPAAQMILQNVFEPQDDVWRGLGVIRNSGMKFRDEFAEFDAAVRFGFHPENKEENAGCRCGDILRGLKEPKQCPLFGTVCTPLDPVGPCMVSSEGACSAAFKYREI